MPVYQITKLIDDLQQQTETFLNKAILDWQNLSPERLLAQPGENKWSAAQCLEHLNSYGYYYLPEIEKAIERSRERLGSTPTHFSAGFLGNFFTNLMKPSASGKKMSAPKNHTPKANLDAYKVIREFIDQQEKLVALLEQARKANLDTKIPISIAKFIKLKLGDVFMFLIAHNERHVLQAERALAQYSIIQREGSLV